MDGLRCRAYLGQLPSCLDAPLDDRGDSVGERRRPRDGIQVGDRINIDVHLRVVALTEVDNLPVDLVLKEFRREQGFVEEVSNGTRVMMEVERGEYLRVADVDDVQPAARAPPPHAATAQRRGSTAPVR